MAAGLGYVFSPSGAVIALALVALWLSRRPASAPARRFAIAAALFYLFASLAIVPYCFSRVLAHGYGQLRASDVPAGTTAIVLLGGGDVFVEGWTGSMTVTTPIEAER